MGPNRTIVIGDIHGALRALDQLLSRISLQPGDHLIFLGDYVDRWPDSAQVIEYLLELEGRYACTFIRGNHDAWCQGWLETAQPSASWLLQGGNSTLESYMAIPAARLVVHTAFFARMFNYYEGNGERLFVHGGFTAKGGPEEEPSTAALYWDRSLWQSAMTLHKRVLKAPILYPRRLKRYKEIYIGHTPTLQYGESVPMKACNVWNIDTGAGYDGRISAMDVDNGTIWQSDPVPSLYPEDITSAPLSS